MVPSTPGTVFKDRAAVDGVLVAAGVAGERHQPRQGVLLDVDDPPLEVLAGPGRLSAAPWQR
jgi:hypothetical protein